MHNQNTRLLGNVQKFLFLTSDWRGMICFSFNIGCSESKVIFKWRKTKTIQKYKGFSRSKRSHLVHFIQSQSVTLCSHRKARHEPAIRDAQKPAQNVFPPWRGGRGEGLFNLRHFSRGLWLSFLVLCSQTALKRLLRRLAACQLPLKKQIKICNL